MAVLKVVLSFSFISGLFTTILAQRNYNSSEETYANRCDCGTTSYSSKDWNGEIKSPNHPEYYCNDMKCTWIIKPGKADTGIRLHFESFATENLADYLDVFYVEGSTVQKLQRLTGVIDGLSLPSFVISDGGLELIFRTDGSVIRSGFFATFSRFNSTVYIRLYGRLGHALFAHYYDIVLVTQEECTCPTVMYEATDRPAVISSPNYPRPYCHAIHCFYFIEAEAPYSVELTVEDLELEGRYDSLTVYDGNNTMKHGSIMANFTGHLNGTRKLVSYTQQMAMIFRADADTSHKGFRARFRKVTGPCSCPPVTTLRGNNGNFSSPGFPISYCSNLNCTYVVNGARRKILQIEFTTLDMYWGDTVSVASSSGGFELPFVKWTASISPFKYTSESSSAKLRLITSSHRTRETEGFNATWRSIDRSRGCFCPRPNPKNITRQEGTITMTACGPLDCQWLLNAPTNQSRALSIWLDNVELERKGWLTIADGAYHRNYSSPNTIRRYTGTSSNNSEVSISRDVNHGLLSPSRRPVTIHYHVENRAANIAHSGFTLRYKWHIQNCDCGPTSLRATAQAQNLSSPSYPGPYCHALRCKYTIRATRGNRIVIELVDMLTEGGLDRLQIFDGVIADPWLGAVPAPIVSLSGDVNIMLEKTLVSNRSELTLAFKTDMSVSYRGWNLTYRSEPIPANATQSPSPAALTCPSAPPCICPSTIPQKTTRWYIKTTPPTTRPTTERLTTKTPNALTATQSAQKVAGRRFGGLPFAIGILVGILISVLVLTGLVFLRKMGYCTGLPELPAVRFQKGQQHTYFSNEAYQPYESKYMSFFRIFKTLHSRV